jgi:hypothetical protein
VESPLLLALVPSSGSHTGRFLWLIDDDGGCCGRGDGLAGDITAIGDTNSHSPSESLLLLVESLLLLALMFSSGSHNGRFLCLIDDDGSCRDCCGRGDGLAGDAAVLGGTNSHSLSDSSSPRDADELEEESWVFEESSDESEDDDDITIGLLICTGGAARGRA